MKFSVVPDHTRSDLGDPVQYEALYRERSPMTHVANINKPFLVTTGSRDFRCYFEDARRFAAALKTHSDLVEYLELDGEGHGYRYPDTLHEILSKRCGFFCLGCTDRIGCSQIKTRVFLDRVVKLIWLVGAISGCVLRYLKWFGHQFAFHGNLLQQQKSNDA